MTSPGTVKHLQDAQLEYICSYWATLAPPEMIGPTPDGIRANLYVKSGEVTGPRIHGRIRPVGGDWLPPARADLRIVPRYHTSHPDYLWLNRLQCVGVGTADLVQHKVSYDIYTLR
jgi:hypothetical protein